MSGFYFGDDSRSISSADDEDNLPYPEALPRSDFLAADFDAPSYLSTLSNRHQTLEDLRTDLRDRSQLLSKELLDLVNTNYEQFLSLGSDLKGGEEKVEDVRVGLLGFQRGIGDIRSKVQQRKVEVENLCAEKSRITKEIAVARNLLEVDARLEELEERLMVASLAKGPSDVGEDEWSESDEDEDDEQDGDQALEGTAGTGKLLRLVQEYRRVVELSDSIGQHNAFIVSQESRVLRIRNTLLLDLGTALKQAIGAKSQGETRLVKIMTLYQQMGEGPEAIKILKDTKI